jgi:hypothetical protein
MTPFQLAQEHPCLTIKEVAVRGSLPDISRFTTSIHDGVPA